MLAQHHYTCYAMASIYIYSDAPRRGPSTGAAPLLRRIARVSRSRLLTPLTPTLTPTLTPALTPALTPTLTLTPTPTLTPAPTLALALALTPTLTLTLTPTRSAGLLIAAAYFLYLGAELRLRSREMRLRSREMRLSSRDLASISAAPSSDGLFGGGGGGGTPITIYTINARTGSEHPTVSGSAGNMRESLLG